MTDTEAGRKGLEQEAAEGAEMWRMIPLLTLLPPVDLPAGSLEQKLGEVRSWRTGIERDKICAACAGKKITGASQRGQIQGGEKLFETGAEGMDLFAHPHR